VFESVKSRLCSEGYSLVSSSVYEQSRHSSQTKIIETVPDVTYDVYDGDCLYDPETDYYSEPIGNYPSGYEKTVPCSDCVEINRLTYIPK
jgi:hypothetical protein